MKKRTAAGVLAVALVLPVLPLTAAGAVGEKGSGFGSVSLNAVARGQEWLFMNQVPAQLSVPYALSNLRFGDGNATATVAWPGDTGASLGTTLVLLGAPEPFGALNDPAVAYARSGSGDADVTNTTVPGSTMHATATKAKATALAAADGSAALGATAGSVSAQSAVELTREASAVGSATSTVRDITLGVVHIAAVTSRATGSTNGTSADATGSTTVAGVSVAGVPVTVDEHGVSVAGTGILPPGAADAVTDALQQAQLTLTLTSPVKTVRAGRVEYSAGGLVATTPLGTLTLGGAQLVLSATLDDPATVDVPVPVPTLEPGVAQPPTSGPPPVVPGAVVLPPTTDAPGELPRTAAPLTSLGPISLRSGYGWAWPVSGLLLTFLTASGLLGLSRRWLAPDLSGCPLEGRLP